MTKDTTTPNREPEEKKTTWTAEEIAEWEEENNGTCPAFRVPHRPERQPVSGNGCLWKDCTDEDTVTINIYSAAGEQEKSRVCEEHLNTLQSQSGVSVEIEDAQFRTDNSE